MTVFWFFQNFFRELKLTSKFEIPNTVLKYCYGTRRVENEDIKEVCTGCQKKVTYRTKEVESEACSNCYHLGYGKKLGPGYADISETVWYCMICKKEQEADGLRMVIKIYGRHS